MKTDEIFRIFVEAADGEDEPRLLTLLHARRVLTGRFPDALNGKAIAFQLGIALRAGDRVVQHIVGEQVVASISGCGLIDHNPGSGKFRRNLPRLHAALRPEVLDVIFLLRFQRTLTERTLPLLKVNENLFDFAPDGTFVAVIGSSGSEGCCAEVCPSLPSWLLSLNPAIEFGGRNAVANHAFTPSSPLLQRLNSSVAASLLPERAFNVNSFIWRSLTPTRVVANPKKSVSNT